MGKGEGKVNMSIFDSPNVGSPSVDLADEFAPQRLLFASMVIIISGGIFYHYFRDTILPYTVVVFLFGIVLGLFSTLPGFDVFQSVFKNFTDLPPRMLFMVFLPVLIFEGSYGIRTHVLQRVIPSAALLAGPGLIINTALIGASLKFMVADGINWYAAFLLGSVLSATDPVAVVCLLKSLGVDASLTALIDAEAIMNDGTAIIAYVLLYPAAVSGSWVTSSAELIVSIFQLVVGAVFLGLAFGVLFHRMLRACEGDGIVFAVLSVALPFVAYFTADVVCDTSGVLTLFFAGTYLSRVYPSHFPGKSHAVLQVTYEFWVQALNTMLFCMVGIIVSRDAVASASLWTVFLQLYMHVASSVCRFLMLVILWPIMNLHPTYKLRWQHIVIAAHGGLKGGVATILTLVIVTSGGLSKEVSTLFLQINLGVVMLSLMTNATTAKNVVQMLKLQARPRHNLVHMALGMRRLQAHVDDALHNTYTMPAYRRAHFPRVHRLATSIQNPYDEVLPVEESDIECFKNLMMRMAKSEIWNLRDSGRLGEDATCVLTKALHARLENTLLDVSAFFDSGLKYPAWIGYTASVSACVGDLLHEHVLEWRFQHDLTTFETLLGFTFILDALERIIPDIATSDEILTFGNEYVAYQRKKIENAVDKMNAEHPAMMASVITQFAATRVLNAAAHAAHDELDAGFSQRDTAALSDSVHAVQHEIHHLPIDGAGITAKCVLPMSPLAEGCSEETLARLDRECKIAHAHADECVKLHRKDVMLILVGSAASTRSLRDLSKATQSIDILVVGCEAGTQCHLSQTVVNDDIIALSELTYGILPGAVVEELMKLDVDFARNVRSAGASRIAWNACRGLMRDALMPRFSKTDAHAACCAGSIIEVGTEDGDAALRSVSNRTVVFLAGSDASGTIRADTTVPFHVPRCAVFQWSRGTLLYVVDFSMAKGAAVDVRKRDDASSSSSSSDADEVEANKQSSLSTKLDAVAVAIDTAGQYPGDAAANAGAVVEAESNDNKATSVEMTEKRRPRSYSITNKHSASPRTGGLGLTYAPGSSSSLIPFVTTGQLQLLLSLERLQFLTKNYASQRLDSEKRQFLEAEVTHTLGQLVTACGALFPAEAGIYRIAIRMCEPASGGAGGSDDGGVVNSGVLRASRWFRPASAAALDELAAGTAGTLPSRKSLRHVVGAALTKHKEDQSALRGKIVGHSRAASAVTLGSNAAASSCSASAVSADAAAGLVSLTREQVQILHNQIEEHEAFLGFVSSFVTGHTSRLVNKKRTTAAAASSASASAAVGEDTLSSAVALAGSYSGTFELLPDMLDDAPSSVSLHRFIRTARAFLNQHCLADRAASELVQKCLGREVVQSLSTASTAMNFWHSCAAGTE